MNKNIGLIVNPVAGMGGSVGLKGTDGDMYNKAVKLGAEPVVPDRTKVFLDNLHSTEQIHFLAAPASMGEQYLKEFDFPYQVVGELKQKTSAEDTRRIAKEMVTAGADLLVFIGGDGTARDIVDAISSEIPVVAVPSGVKMFSSAFALNPRAAAEMVEVFIEGASFAEEEVLDIDEEEYRQDRLASRLYGYLLVPKARQLLQHGKTRSNVEQSIQALKKDIATYVVEEEMDPETLYLLGPGTTIQSIMEEMGHRKTLLGIDAVYDRELIGMDINESQILELLDKFDNRVIIVTPIGGNGFIFGRGSKQFTPRVIQAVGRDHIMVVGTRTKVDPLDCLRVDTGDQKTDKALSGYIKVIVNAFEGKVMKVVS